MSNKSITQLEAEIELVSDRAQKAKWKRSRDLGRLERRLVALQQARQRYYQQHDHLARPVAQLEDELVVARQRLDQSRAALVDAQRVFDAIGPKLAEAQAALAALEPIWPAEERFAPPDRQIFDPQTGRTQYFCGDQEVSQDGSPLPSY